MHSGSTRISVLYDEIEVGQLTEECSDDAHRHSALLELMPSGRSGMTKQLFCTHKHVRGSHTESCLFALPKCTRPSGCVSETRTQGTHWLFRGAYLQGSPDRRNLRDLQRGNSLKTTVRSYLLSWQTKWQDRQVHAFVGAHVHALEEVHRLSSSKVGTKKLGKDQTGTQQRSQVVAWHRTKLS